MAVTEGEGVSAVKQGAGRPMKGYFTADGIRVPGVTTITGFYKTRQLMVWANKEGLAGRSIDEKRDEAASVGSLVHGWIESYIHGRDGYYPTQDEPEFLVGAWSGFKAFLDWAEQVDLNVIETEAPLISERYRYGGTLDAVALVGGTLKLLDWKTSGGVYSSMLAQLGAYRQLLRERDGNTAPDAAQLLRVGKEHGDFHFHSYPQSILDLGWRQFLLWRESYELEKELKKVAA
jgi:hypothetical protein